MVDVASILLIATGFVLGIAHSFDPDHVVAVSALLCNSTSLRKSIISATAWGTGHSVTLLLVGLLVLGLRISIPDSVINLFEFAAGLMLIFLGTRIITPFVAAKTHINQHRSGTETEAQVHIDDDSKVHKHTNIHKSVFTGLLQGMGGSAALMLVTLTTASSAELGLIFILIFCVGVIAGMVSTACLISSILTYTAAHLEKVHEKIRFATGLLSIGFGVFIIIQVVLQLHF